MTTTRRTGFVLGLAMVLVAAFAGYMFHQLSLRRAAAIEAAIQNGPLAISVRVNAGYAPPGSSWDLYVDSSGKGSWNNDGYPTRTTRRLAVTTGQLDELRKALLREYFFDLADSYGEQVVDRGMTTIQVTAGEFSKTVELAFLGNWTGQPEKLRAPNRAVHVFELVQSWVDVGGKKGK